MKDSGITDHDFKMEIEIGNIEGHHGMGFKAVGNPHYLESAVKASIRYNVEETEASIADGQDKTAQVFKIIAESYCEVLREISEESKYGEKVEKQFSKIQTDLLETYNTLHNGLE